MNTTGPASVTSTHLTLALSPHGRLILTPSDDAPALDPALARRLLDAFALGSGHGLLQLGGAEVGHPLPPVFSYWRELGGRYVTTLCTPASADTHHAAIPPRDTADLHTFALGAPAMLGAEYVSAQVLEALWHEMDAAFVTLRAQARCTTEELLRTLSPAWHMVGRVYFNLAENRKDDLAPFAFLATYTRQLSARGKAQHLPLGDALREYAGAKNHERLLSLLLPVQRAAAQCVWLREMVEAGEVFHPLRWSAADAFRFLSDVPELERAGIIVRMPASWRANRPARPLVSSVVGSRAPTGLGTAALLDFSMAITLDGARLTAAEVSQILAGTRGLAFIRGQWIEVDSEQLQRTMERFKDAERIAAERGLTFAEAMRLLSGADVTGTDGERSADRAWSHVNAGAWLSPLLQSLRSPEELAPIAPGRELRGTLRPYQEVGVRWLHLLSRLGLGACLADDMGLGKTIQVLALLLLQRRTNERAGMPNLLIVPASLIANWKSEIAQFAPALQVIAAHQSTLTATELAAIDAQRLAEADLVITTYGSLRRFAWISGTKWNLVILDEAQAIKNPGAKQTRTVKQLSARARIALTGTPVENRLSDLWSIFDFINPGLLGSAKQFGTYSKRLAATPQNPYASLRELVRPYILRRLKTDRSVISDLPEKTEMKAYCQLTRKQAALYQDSVRELRDQIAAANGVRRKGLILTFLMRFKQICNHPSQWLKDDAWDAADSGKLVRLGELAEVIAAKQDKVLVFTQFREMTDPLAAFLGRAFGRPGLTLHGGTVVRKREELVRRFQDDELVPFFVISLKAGGSGLNLTAASHVIHFDRWWNPAVESQATDRAFRIGQTKNVLVHKFVCRGTVEEKIDQLIESKTQLSRELLAGGAELNLTELNDDELMRLVSLDLNAATKE